MDSKNLPNYNTNENNVEQQQQPFPPPPYIDVRSQDHQNSNVTYILPPNAVPPNQFVLGEGPPILNSYSVNHHNNSRRHCHGYPYTRYPTTLYCYKCNQYVFSVVSYEKGEKFKRNLLILLFLCLICPPLICIIPILLLTDSLKDSVHKCPSCGTIIGIHVVY
uniref:LITAF domain-containing protein n=1 Tax=Strongyloides venezuelensis TaxID=75913 RepID=A0A0K0F483_STRVS